MTLLSTHLQAQTPAPSPSQVISQPQAVRPLPGQLDDVLTFNSNSPEVVQTPGILLSTFPPQGMQVPQAHLNLPLQGRFDIFAHHIARAASPEDLRTLYLGILLHNPGQRPITVDVLQAASYLSQPDAPFLPLPSQQDNATGTIFAGPGDRVVNEVLRGERQSGWPAKLELGPGQSQMLMNLPIPVRSLTPPLHGRSAFMRLRSTGSVHVASLGMYAPIDTNGQERPPTLEEWQTLLQTGGLAGPRDKAPTPLDNPGKLIYGRVAGVARGSRWRAQLTDTEQQSLQIPQPGQAFSYGLSTLVGGRMGTGQVQSAPMLVRYPDTAYQAHGNYAIEYNLSLPLYNPSDVNRTIALTIETPQKFDVLNSGQAAQLRFLQPPPARVFFRGTVRFRYRDDQGTPQSRYVHLVQQQGQQGQPLVTLNLPPRSRRFVQVDFLYPPDATPPQVLTVRSLD